jgi:hypothetical protein
MEDAMAWPWLAIVAKNVPWAELVRRAPDILARSRELLEESRRPRPKPAPALESAPAELRRRIEVLEARDAEHARIIAPMVEQLQGLTEAVQVLTARNRLLAWLVAALLAVQLLTLVGTVR